MAAKKTSQSKIVDLKKPDAFNIFNLQTPEQQQAAGNVLDLFGSVMQIRSGGEINANNILLGSEVSSSGSMLNAAMLRQQKESLKATVQFNRDIDNINVSRSLQKLSNDFTKLTGLNQAAAAAQNLNVGSKSFQILRNETLDSFSRQFSAVRTDAINRDLARNYQADINAVQLENQARAEEYTAAASLVLAKANAAASRESANSQAMLSLKQGMKEVPNLLGSVFGESK